MAFNGSLEQMFLKSGIPKGPQVCREIGKGQELLARCAPFIRLR